MHAGHDPAFRILQVADFHSDVSEALNERTRDDVRAMARLFQPHLLAVTGDIWCGDEHPGAAPMWMQRDLDFFGSLGVPWAFTWGNHDYYGDFQQALAKIAATPNAIAPNGGPNANFRIEVVRGGDSRPCWDLFFINSGPSWNLPADLSCFESESRRLHEQRGTIIPAIAFFHIPTGNYQTAIDEKRTIGIGTESVLGWGDDDNRAAAILKRPGNLRACFTSHSHRNDFYFEEDGLIFAYGRATGYGGYGEEDLKKGGKLLELSLENHTLAFKTVFADGSTWSPHHETP